MSWVFTREQLAKWRIRKAPEGVVPPWREGAPADLPTPGRWWVFAPKSRRPRAACSSWDIAMRHVQDAILTELIAANPEAARILEHTRPAQ